MQIQALNTTNQNKTSFGLKLSNEAAASIIEEYKKYGAKNSEIAYHLRAIQKSAPDTFTLVKNDTNTKLQFFYDGCDRIIDSNIKVERNDHKYVNERLEDFYPYDDENEYIHGAPYNYNAENKVFFSEHLIKVINSAVKRLKAGEYDGEYDSITDLNNNGNNFEKYKDLLEMSKKWPHIPMD